MAKFIALLWCVFSFSLMSQPLHDSVLDGTTLLNLKNARTNVFYKYVLDKNSYTLLKFKNGKVIDYIFNDYDKHKIKIDTFYYTDKSGIAITLNKKIKTPQNELRISKTKNDFYLVVTAIDIINHNYNGNEYCYHSNKQLCLTRIKRDDKFEETKYTRKGKLSSIRIEDDFNRYKKATIYNKKGAIDFTMRTENGITVYEKFDGKNHLIKVDSTNADFKAIGTWVTYYPNGVLKTKIPFTDGLLDGIYYTYYESGAIKTIEVYILGNKAGKYIYYNKDGTIKKEVVYNKN